MNIFLRVLAVFACAILISIPIFGWVLVVLNASGWVVLVISVLQAMLTVFALAGTVTILNMVWDMTKKEG